MSELVTNKVTIEDLIARKDEIQASKRKSVKMYVESLDGYVVLSMPDRRLIADSMDFDNGIESNVHLVSNSMVEPNLKDDKLQEAFNVHTPKELLQTIIGDGEVGFIAEELMNVAGYKKSNVKVIEEIKN